MTAWPYSVKCHIYYNRLCTFFYRTQFEMPFFKLIGDVVSTYLTQRILEMLALCFGWYTGTDWSSEGYADENSCSCHPLE